MKTVEELKKEHKDQLAKLKAQQKAEVERVKAVEKKKEALERAGERKAENHVKYLLAGNLIAEMKQSGDVSRLKTLAESLTNDRDKTAAERLIASVTGAPDSGTATGPESGETGEPAPDKKRGGVFRKKN